MNDCGMHDSFLLFEILKNLFKCTYTYTCEKHFVHMSDPLNNNGHMIMISLLVVFMPVALLRANIV